MINTLAHTSFQRVTTSLQSFYQLRLNRIHKFKAKVNIFFEVGNFEVKTINDVDELKEALALRYEVFHREMRGKKSLNGIDVDEFDFFSDHLVIRDKRSDKIVATYRLNCSAFSNEFYSAREFNLSKIFRETGIKLELGRACIHQDFRKGILVSLLWRGIAEYMVAVDAKILFGCATVKTDDPQDAALLTRYFEDENRILNSFRTRPTIEYKMPLLDYFLNEIRSPLSEAQKTQAEEILPPLCRSYLKIGASIGGEPAWDQEFECIDFLTILQRDDLNRNLWAKYKLQ